MSLFDIIRNVQVTYEVKCLTRFRSISRGPKTLFQMFIFLPDRDVGDCLFDNSGGHEKGWLG